VEVKKREGGPKAQKHNMPLFRVDSKLVEAPDAELAAAWAKVVVGPEATVAAVDVPIRVTASLVKAVQTRQARERAELERTASRF